MTYIKMNRAVVGNHWDFEAGQKVQLNSSYPIKRYHGVIGIVTNVPPKEVSPYPYVYVKLPMYDNASLIQIDYLNRL